MKEHVEWWLSFQKRVDDWDKSRDRVYEDKRECVFKFAVEVLDADPSTARNFVYRETIKWDMIKCFETRGKRVQCKVCGSEGYGGYWCKPCIHHGWCCECCILLGIPFYGTSMGWIGKRECPHCGHEFGDVVSFGSTINLGLGVTVTKKEIEKKTCPKCKREL